MSELRGFPANAFYGFQLIEVEPGTVIDGPNGEKITVSDDAVALNSRMAYVTPKVMAAIKNASIERK